ncbi:ribonuclease E inhibitor RraB [Metabacillus idriensis]|uniref:ribonuclease E inhibitor RraB n=1 Tax=Metabacillus idriensis TaxID=324768 RepID=UPI00163AB9DD|nr:ribonuclease E inhibitor RraB [Metabacillus idriensis]QNG60278.1 ribonuclease E inhibitor RraB [Bacillus sp. PAMC26568]
MNFPKDEDGKVLNMLYKEGLNFKKPHMIDFYVAVPDQKNGEAILKALSDKGYKFMMEYDDDVEEWTCFGSVKMHLKHNEIVGMQKKLDEICKPLGGYADGWGVMTE